ncbi:MAG TPA: hypothetical protein VJ801_03815, partial [Polyangia bacterium]|nr:hypothetical protein [Polyangia bacterium]
MAVGPRITEEIRGWPSRQSVSIESEASLLDGTLSCAQREINGGWVTIQLRSGDNESAHLPHPLEDFLQFSYRK